MDKFCVFVLHANAGRESQTKDLCIIRISIFGAFSAGKGAHFTWVNTVITCTS